MSPDQRAMCFAIWKECMMAFRAARVGMIQPDERAARMAITRKAIGRELSWGATWRQHEIDRLIGVMWAISRSDDINLQLRQLEQPFTRAEGSVFARVYLAAIGIEEHGREAYLDAVSRRINKKPLCEIDDDDWRDVLAALNHTAMHKLGISHSHRRGSSRVTSSGQNVASQMPATNRAARTGSPVAGESDGNPF